MEFHLIMVDGVNNSTKEVEENSTVQKNDRNSFTGNNFLGIRNDAINDDGDSGIHESNEVLGPSPVPSHRKLLESSVDDGVIERLRSCKRSASVNSLIERRRSCSQSFRRSVKKRNYSIDTGRSSSLRARKTFSPYKLIIIDDDGKTVFVKKVYRDSVKSITKRDPLSQSDGKPDLRKQNGGNNINDLCQIHILLIIMKIILGGSVTVIGLFLKSFSRSLDVKDCGYWASSVLFISGLMSIYFAMDSLLFVNKRLHNIYLVLTVVISCTSSILCMIAGVQSGMHGNWISFYADDCTFTRPTAYSAKEIICCINTSTDKEQQSTRNWNLADNSVKNQTDTVDGCACLHSQQIQRLYVGLTCKYLFSSLKDYFVLICSLLAVGSGCDIWFVAYLLMNVSKVGIRYDNSGPREKYFPGVKERCHGNQLPSPIMPAMQFP